MDESSTSTEQTTGGSSAVESDQSSDSTEARSGLRVVNPDARYEKARFIEPTPLGYIHVAAERRP